MKRYEIVRCGEAPDWDGVCPLNVDTVLWLTDVGIRMTQQLCHNAERLFVRQVCAEEHIRAEYNDPLGMVCEDSCMEFFFMPAGDDRYINFEINPNGCFYLGFGRERGERTRLLPDGAGERFDLRTRRLAGGWECTYALPLAYLRQFFGRDFSYSSGAVLRANCYKCGDLTERPHYLSWNPVTSAAPDFHRPSDFGEMVLL